MKRIQKFMRALKRGEKGFTLIELLVVIGILAVLIAVVALNVGKFIGKGACEAYCVEWHNSQTAVLAYMADNQGDVPGTVADAGDYYVCLLYTSDAADE